MFISIILGYLPFQAASISRIERFIVISNLLQRYLIDCRKYYNN